MYMLFDILDGFALSVPVQSRLTAKASCLPLSSTADDGPCAAEAISHAAAPGEIMLDRGVTLTSSSLPPVRAQVAPRGERAHE